MSQFVYKKDNIFVRAHKKFMRKSLSEKITYCLFFALFLIMAIIFIYPIYSTFLNSFRNNDDYMDPVRSPFALPKVWITGSWASIFTEFVIQDTNYWGLLYNSLWMLVVRVTVNILASTFLAYAVARFRFPGRNFIYGVVIFTQTIPIIGSGAAGHKLFVSLNMINNPYTFWIAWAVGFDFAFIVLYGTFKGISSTYSEAAKIDGANNCTVLFKIIFPQAMPSIMALAITQAIGVWNDFNTPLIYLSRYPNIAYGLYVFKDACWYLENTTAIHSAAIILSMLPVMILYAASQKMILTNMTTGGLKG